MQPPYPATCFFLRYRPPHIGFVAAYATFVVARQYSIVKDHRQHSAIGTRRKRGAFGFLSLWWAWVESNYRPHPYQGCALAN
jgi:hypothetical protein